MDYSAYVSSPHNMSQTSCYPKDHNVSHRSWMELITLHKCDSILGYDDNHAKRDEFGYE